MTDIYEKLLAEARVYRLAWRDALARGEEARATWASEQVARATWAALWAGPWGDATASPDARLSAWFAAWGDPVD